MGSRGPQPQPTALRILRGNPSHRPVNDREPAPPGDDGSPPEGLSPGALECWTHAVKVLIGMGLWSAAERAVLSRYCWLHDMRQLAEAKLREQGPVQEIVTQTGSLQSQQTAFFTVAVKLHEQMLAIEREFGFTPASRTRLMVQPAEAQNDPLAAFVARRSS